MKNRSAFSRRPASLSQLIYALRHYRIDNPGLKLLSLLLALLFFAISRQPVVDVTLVSVPLEFRGLRQGLEISSDFPKIVSVRLRGPQDIIRSTTSAQIGVVADLSAREPGERVVQLKPADVTPLDNVTVLRIEPASIRLHIEPTIEKSIPVEPRFTGRLPDGFDVASVTVDPPAITVTGPQSHLNGFGLAQTESIHLGDWKQSFTASVDLDVSDRFVRVVTPGTIKVSVEIRERKQP